MPNRYPANLRVNCLVFTAFWDAATLYCFTCTDPIALVAISMTRCMNFVQKRPANYLERVITR